MSRFVLAFFLIAAAVTHNAFAQEAGATGEGEPTAAAPGGAIDPADLESFVDGIIADQLQTHHVPGATVAIVKDGKPALVKGYGLADVEREKKVDGDTTLFRIGSISKLFTWTSVMQLKEAGALSLDDDVNQYLTSFQVPATFKEPIRIRNLMTHTPGLEDIGVGYVFVRGPEDFLTLEEALKRFMPARVWEPGVRAAYSNWGAALAGLIVEKASGMDFDDYEDAGIFEPLEMSRTTFREPLPEALAADMSIGYLHKGGEFKPQPFEYTHNVAPAGAISSTAGDMAKFMIAHLQDGAYGEGRILGPESTREMRERLFTPDPRLRLGLGHGFIEHLVNGRLIYTHGGDTRYHHSMMVLLPEEDFGLFISFNADPGSARGNLVQAVMDRYYPAADGAEESEAGQAVAPPQEEIAEIVGSYRSNRSAYTKFEKVFGALSEIGVNVADDGEMIVDGTRYGYVEPLLWEDPKTGNRIAFGRDESGRVKYIFGDDALIMAGEKIPVYERGSVHVLLGAIALLTFIGVFLTSARHLDRFGAASPLGAGAHWASLAASLLLLAFAVLIAFVFATTDIITELYYGYPDSVRPIMALPVIATVPALIAVGCAALAWARGSGTVRRRFAYSVSALMPILFLAILVYWNAYGWWTL
jgi:CubicO group peptidase (beta-lactamase class C family)